jgi:hypothetical protein
MIRLVLDRFAQEDNADSNEIRTKDGRCPLEVFLGLEPQKLTDLREAAFRRGLTAQEIDLLIYWSDERRWKTGHDDSY